MLFLMLLGLMSLIAAHQERLIQHDLTIPSIGLGLWNSKGKNATKAVDYAFEAGYNHLDSAAAYGNEDFVGDAIKSGPKRSSYWITSKIWNTMHEPENVEKALNKTLSDLKTDYLDLYLMHWPVAFKPDTDRTIIDQDTTIVDTWKAMEQIAAKFKDTGKGAKHIGISNFSPRQIDQILAICEICPYAHEFETHPYLQQQEFVDWHAEKKIKVIAYSPLANLNPTYKTELPPILEDEFWTDMSKKKNVTTAQAILGWGIQRGTIVIPKSIHESRIKENFDSQVKFSKKEMEEIAKQDKKTRFNNPSEDWGVDLFEGLDDGNDRYVNS